jgi:hypothetical protein
MEIEYGYKLIDLPISELFVDDSYQREIMGIVIITVTGADDD